MGNSVQGLKKQLESQEFGQSDAKTTKTVRAVRRASTSGRMRYDDIINSTGIDNLINCIETGSFPQRNDSCIALLALLRNEARMNKTNRRTNTVVKRTLEKGAAKSTISSMRDVSYFVAAAKTLDNYEKGVMLSEFKTRSVSGELLTPKSSASSQNELLKMYNDNKKRTRRNSLGDPRIVRQSNIEKNASPRTKASSSPDGSDSVGLLTPHTESQEGPPTADDAPNSRKPRTTGRHAARASAPAEFSRVRRMIWEDVSSDKALEHIQNGIELLNFLLENSEAESWVHTIHSMKLALLLRWILLFQERGPLLHSALHLIRTICSKSPSNKASSEYKKVFFAEIVKILGRLLCVAFSHKQLSNSPRSSIEQEEKLELVDTLSAARNILFLMHTFFVPTVRKTDDISSTNVLELLLAIFRDAVCYFGVISYQHNRKCICNEDCTLCRSHFVEDEGKAEVDDLMAKIISDVLHSIHSLLPVKGNRTHLRTRQHDPLTEVLSKANRGVCCGVPALVLTALNCFQEAEMQSPMQDLLKLQSDDIKSSFGRNMQIGFGPLKGILDSSPPEIYLDHRNQNNKRYNFQFAKDIAGSPCNNVKHGNSIPPLEEVSGTVDSAFTLSSERKPKESSLLSSESFQHCLEIIHVFAAYGDQSVVCTLWECGCHALLDCLLADTVRHMFAWYEVAVKEMNDKNVGSVYNGPFWKQNDKVVNEKNRRSTFTSRHLPLQVTTTRRRNSSHSLVAEDNRRESGYQKNLPAWFLHLATEEIRESMPMQLSEEQCAECMLSFNIALHMATCTPGLEPETECMMATCEDYFWTALFVPAPKTTSDYCPVISYPMLQSVVQFVSLLRDALPAPPEDRHRTGDASLSTRSKIPRGYHSEGDVSKCLKGAVAEENGSVQPFRPGQHNSSHSFSFSSHTRSFSSKPQQVDASFSRRRHKTLSFMLRGQSVTPLQPDTGTNKNVETLATEPNGGSALNVLQFPAPLRNCCFLALLTLSKVIERVSLKGFYEVLLSFSNGAIPADFVFAKEFLAKPRRKWVRRESALSPSSVHEEEELQTVSEDNMGNLFRANSSRHRTSAASTEINDVGVEVRVITGVLVVADVAVRILGSRKMSQKIIDCASNILLRICRVPQLREPLACMNFCSVDTLVPQLQHRTCTLASTRRIARILFFLSTLDESICDRVLVDKEVQYGLIGSLRASIDDASVQMALLRLIIRAGEGATPGLAFSASFFKFIVGYCVPLMNREHPLSILYQTCQSALEVVSKCVGADNTSHIEDHYRYLQDKIRQDEVAMGMGKETEIVWKKANPEKEDSIGALTVDTISSSASLGIPQVSDSYSGSQRGKHLPQLITGQEANAEHVGIVSPGSSLWKNERRSSLGNALPQNDSPASKPPLTPKKPQSKTPLSTSAINSRQKGFWTDGQSFSQTSLPPVRSPLNNASKKEMSPLKSVWQKGQPTSHMRPADKQNIRSRLNDFQPSEGTIPEVQELLMGGNAGRGGILPNLPESITEQSW